MSDQNPSVVSPQPQLPAPPADAQNPAAQPAALPAPSASPEPPASVPGPAALPEPIDHTSRDEEMVLNAPGGLGELITGDNLPNYRRNIIYDAPVYSKPVLATVILQASTY